MTIDELGAARADTETPTVTLSTDDAAAIAETYQDADEQRHVMAEQLQAANAANLVLQAKLDEAKAEIGRLQHQNTALIRQNSTLRRESNTLMEKFAKDLQDALGLADAEPEFPDEPEDEDLDDVHGQADEGEADQ